MVWVNLGIFGFQQQAGDPFEPWEWSKLCNTFLRVLWRGQGRRKPWSSRVGQRPWVPFGIPDWESWDFSQPNSSCWAGRCSLSPTERRDKAVAGSQMRTAQLWLLLGSFVPLVWPDLRTIIKTHSSHKVSWPRKIRHSRNGFSNGTV